MTCWDQVKNEQMRFLSEIPFDRHNPAHQIMTRDEFPLAGPLSWAKGKEIPPIMRKALQARVAKYIRTGKEDKMPKTPTEASFYVIRNKGFINA